MAMKICFIATLCVVSSILSIASTTDGTTTFYTNYVSSACYQGQIEGVMIAAGSDPLWNNGAICGKMFIVTCAGPTNAVPHPCTEKSITVKIVDNCPSCGRTLDLSKEAFPTIADPVAGIIKISYQE